MAVRLFWSVRVIQGASVILVAGVLVLAAVSSAAARPGPGFSGAHPGARFDGHHRFDGQHRFDGHRFFRRDHVRIFVAPFLFAPPIVAAPVFVGPPPVWYYCPSYGAYYPYVSSCPEPWVPVPAQ